MSRMPVERDPFTTMNIDYFDPVEIATVSGWIDHDVCTAGDVQLWDDDEVLALLTADERRVSDAA